MDEQTTTEGQHETVSFGPIQHNLSNIKPTAAEIGHLWSTYLAETQAVSMLKHMVAKSKDPDYYTVLQLQLDTASKNIELMKEMFNIIQHPIPFAFGENDVDINTPQLFDEEFSVKYTRLMTKIILLNHSLSFSECTRSDFRSLFSRFVDGAKGVIDRADDVLLAKGVYSKPPYIIAPDTVDFVQRKSYYGSFFGNKRPLNALEIINIFKILEYKMVMKALKLGFSQVVKSDEIRKHLNQGVLFTDKQIKALRPIIEREGLPAPIQLDYQVTDSKESPYSDKLILFHIINVVGYLINLYGLGLSRILKKDIAVTYIRFIADLLAYSKDGVDLLIKNGWLEKIPGTADRRELIH